MKRLGPGNYEQTNETTLDGVPTLNTWRVTRSVDPHNGETVWIASCSIDGFADGSWHRTKARAVWCMEESDKDGWETTQFGICLK